MVTHAAPVTISDAGRVDESSYKASPMPVVIISPVPIAEPMAVPN